MLGTPKQKKKQKTLNLSFKETERDNLIYDEICKHSSKGDL